MATFYEALPLHASPERAEILSTLMRGIAATDSVFSDAPCEKGCVKETPLPDMCRPCLARMERVTAMLTAPDSLAFEVWRLAGSEASLAGVIFFTEVVRGLDATGHYIFFDERLNDKTEVMEGVILEVFEDLTLERLTIEIPEPFLALARHAQKRLGFGGDFRHVVEHGEKKTSLRVEGVKRGAAMWKGEAVDLLVLGRLKAALPIVVSAPVADLDDD